MAGFFAGRLQIKGIRTTQTVWSIKTLKRQRSWICPWVHKGTPARETERKECWHRVQLHLDPGKGCPYEHLSSSPLWLYWFYISTFHIFNTPCLQLKHMQQLPGILELLMSPGVPLPHRAPACQGLATSGHIGRSQLGLRTPAFGQSRLAGRDTGAE